MQMANVETAKSNSPQQQGLNITIPKSALSAAVPSCITASFCARIATGLLRAIANVPSPNPTGNEISTLELSLLKDDLSLMEKLLNTKRS